MFCEGLERAVVVVRTRFVIRYGSYWCFVFILVLRSREKCLRGGRRLWGFCGSRVKWVFGSDVRGVGGGCIFRIFILG